MSAPLVSIVPVAGVPALLTMSGSTPRGSSPEGWAGAANDPVGGGASAQKLTIGYLLCDEEDHHHPPRTRIASAGSGRSAAADVALQRRGEVEQQHRAASAPPRPPAAVHRPASARDDAGAGRSRVGVLQAGHGSSSGTHDEREPRPAPTPPRPTLPASQGERAARLSIPPLRLPPGGRQGEGPTSSGGSIQWPRVPAQQMGRLGDGPQQWSPLTPWVGPLVSRGDRPLPLPPVHLANPPAGETWSGHRGESMRHPVPPDPRAPPQETPPVRSERATDRASQGASHPAPLGEATHAARQRQRPLPALWHPPPAAESDPPSSGGARVAGPDLPRQRPYVPVEGRVARAAPWQRSVGGVGGGVGLPYPPLRALRTAGRGLSSVFHGGLPPLLPPSSTSLSLAQLQRPSPPAAPLTRRFDHTDAANAPAEVDAEGSPTAAPDRDALRQPGHPGGDTKERMPDREQSNQPPQLQPVNANGGSRRPVEAEVPHGAGGLVFSTDKPELDPVRILLGRSIPLWLLIVLLLSREAAAATRFTHCMLREMSSAQATTSEWLSRPRHTHVDGFRPRLPSLLLLDCCYAHVHFGHG